MSSFKFIILSVPLSVHVCSSVCPSVCFCCLSTCLVNELCRPVHQLVRRGQGTYSICLRSAHLMMQVTCYVEITNICTTGMRVEVERISYSIHLNISYNSFSHPIVPAAFRVVFKCSSFSEISSSGYKLIPLMLCYAASLVH